MHRRKRRDKNHGAIIRSLRLFPQITAVDIADFGFGIGDLLVGYNGQNFLFEIKDPEKPRSKKKLTKDESLFHKKWTGHIQIVHTYQEILKAINYNIIVNL